MNGPNRRGTLPKASDLWREFEGYSLEGSRVSFERAFPTIASVIVRVEDPGGGVRSLNKGEFGQYINCVDLRCDGGGFPIGSIIERMVADRMSVWDSTEVCCGQERNPGRSRRWGGIRGPCTKTYRVRVAIEFTDLAMPK